MSDLTCHLLVKPYPAEKNSTYCGIQLSNTKRFEPGHYGAYNRYSTGVSCDACKRFVQTVRMATASGGWDANGAPV